MNFAAISKTIAGGLGLYLQDAPKQSGDSGVIQWVAGILAVIILVVVIQRRRTRAK